MNREPLTDQFKLQTEIAAYQHPGRWRSTWQLVNSLIPYILLWYVAWRTLEYSAWLTLPVIALMAGFLVRIFIVFHDCGHGSFFGSKKANDFWGRITGVLTFTPYHRWRASHARHHATSGNLDKRGQGDVWMMTLQEFEEASPKERLKYRLYRNPFVMFLLGPLLITLVNKRIAGKEANRSERRSVIRTNLAIAAVSVIMILLIGWKAYLYIQLPALFIAHVVGVWLFYVQHQFEGVYWKRSSDWDFISAALEGGSFYKLPAVLRWFTGNIGYHHLHHLNSRIPNYNLPRCQESVPALQRTPAIGFFASLKSLTFRLLDEESGRLISFREVRRLRSQSAGV